MTGKACHLGGPEGRGPGGQVLGSYWRLGAKMAKIAPKTAQIRLGCNKPCADVICFSYDFIRFS